jgi:3-hydroxyisobutyrate dehydrogenase
VSTYGIACATDTRKERHLRIGIAGTGRMGAAIAGRLLSLGLAITVWNRSPEKTRTLAAHGASVAANPSQLAAMSEVVISVLTDAEAIDRTYLHSDGLLTGEVAGKLFVEMSTVRPATQVALAARVNQKGASLIECPVAGSVGPARDGRLFAFLGGDAADIARARPVLAHLCRRIEHVGLVGAGARMKLATNLPLLVYWQAFGEALALCQPLGLEPARLMSIFADTSGAPAMLQARSGALAAAIAGAATGPVTFDIDSVRKDMQAMMEEAHALGMELPLVERALACFDQAAREGLGAEDCAVLPARWAQRALAA